MKLDLEFVVCTSLVVWGWTFAIVFFKRAVIAPILRWQFRHAMRVAKEKRNDEIVKKLAERQERNRQKKERQHA